MPEPVTAEQLTEDFDLSRECAAIAISSAAALDDSTNPVVVVQQAIALWPEQVSDHALVVGQRVALTLMYLLEIPTNVLAEVGERLRQHADDQQEVPNDNGSE